MVETRWNSTYKQLKELIEQVNVVNAVAAAKDKSPSAVSSNDVELVNRLIVVLQPFDQATNMVNFLLISISVFLILVMQR